MGSESCALTALLLDVDHDDDMEQLAGSILARIVRVEKAEFWK